MRFNEFEMALVPFLSRQIVAKPDDSGFDLQVVLGISGIQSLRQCNVSIKVLYELLEAVGQYYMYLPKTGMECQSWHSIDAGVTVERYLVKRFIL